MRREGLADAGSTPCAAAVSGLVLSGLAFAAYLSCAPTDAEAHGLNALGRCAIDGGTDVLAVTGFFRSAPFEATTFGVGRFFSAVQPADDPVRPEVLEDGA